MAATPVPVNDKIEVWTTSVVIIPAKAVQRLLIISNPSENERLWLKIGSSDTAKEAVAGEGFFINPWEKWTAGPEKPIYGVITGIYESETNEVPRVYY